MASVNRTGSFSCAKRRRFIRRLISLTRLDRFSSHECLAIYVAGVKNKRERIRLIYLLFSYFALKY